MGYSEVNLFTILRLHQYKPNVYWECDADLQEVFSADENDEN